MPAPGTIQRVASLFSAIHPGERLTDGQAIRNMINLLFTPRAGLTALAGGGFANATPMESSASNAAYVEFDVVATANDSVMLPYPLAGREITVFNNGAAAMQAFSPNGSTGPSSIIPPGQRSTAAVLGTAGVSIAAGGCSTFVCFQTDVWKQQQ